MRHHSIWLTVCLFGALWAALVLDRILPLYMPFRSFYLVLVAGIAWNRNAWYGAAVAAVCIADLTFIDEWTPGHPWAAVWSLATRIPLYATVIYVIVKHARDRAKLTKLSLADPLTGLANRRHFDAVAEEELARAQRYQRPLTIAVLDVNAFKGFNDTYGHVAGDNVLRRIGAELRSCLRSTDTIARIGGDEFAIIFPETTESQAHTALATVTRQLAEIYPPGTSVGVNELQTNIATVRDLLEKSDKAMYHAKRAHRSVR